MVAAHPPLLAISPFLALNSIKTTESREQRGSSKRKSRSSGHLTKSSRRSGSSKRSSTRSSRGRSRSRRSSSSKRSKSNKSGRKRTTPSSRTCGSVQSKSSRRQSGQKRAGSRSRSTKGSTTVKRRGTVTNRKTDSRMDIERGYQKQLKSEAEVRQRGVNILHVALLGMQTLVTIGVIAAVTYIYVTVEDHTDWVNYLIQGIVETVLLLAATIVLCNSNACFRIALVSGHMCVIIHAFFLVKRNIGENHYVVECWNSGDNCIFTWPVKTKFHTVYLGAASVGVHLFLTVLCVLLTLLYEGSTGEKEQTERGHALLTAQLAARELCRDCMGGNKKKRSSGSVTRKGGPQMIVRLEDAVVTDKKETKKADALIHNKKGEPIGYGRTETSSHSIICETPKVAEKRLVREQMQQQSQSATSQPRTPTPSKIVEMPALESPLAYLKRKEKEASQKKSSYVF